MYSTKKLREKYNDNKVDCDVYCNVRAYVQWYYISPNPYSVVLKKEPIYREYPFL